MLEGTDGYWGATSWDYHIFHDSLRLQPVFTQKDIMRQRSSFQDRAIKSRVVLGLWSLKNYGPQTICLEYMKYLGCKWKQLWSHFMSAQIAPPSKITLSSPRKEWSCVDYTWKVTGIFFHAFQLRTYACNGYICHISVTYCMCMSWLCYCL